MRLLHTADWHLREFQFGTSSRCEDHFEAARSTILQAKKENVDIILNGGDLFNSSKLTSTLFVQLLRLNQELNNAGLKMLTVTGNHDMCDPPWHSIIAEEAEVLGQPCAIIPLDWKTVEINGCKILGIPSCSPDQLVKTVLEYPDVDVCLWHGAVLEFIGYTSAEVLRMEDVPFKGAAFLMGDIHVCKYLEHNGRLFGYPGPTELQKKDEAHKKTASIINIENGKAVVEKLVDVNHRKVLSFDILDENQMPEVLKQLKAHKKQKTIALVDYDSRIEDVSRRLQGAVDPNFCILRSSPKGQSLVEVGRVVETAVVAGKPLPQFAELYFQRDTPLWGLAEGLLRNLGLTGEEINHRIQQYVDQRLSYGE